MNIDGEIKPDVIIISVPGKLIADLENQYTSIGYPSFSKEKDTALDAALVHVYTTVQKYIPAGSPYIIIDENNTRIPIPNGEQYWSL